MITAIFSARWSLFSFISVLLFLSATGCNEMESNKSYLLTKPAQSNPIGPRCSSSGAGSCLALHIVAFKAPDGQAVVSENDAIANLENMNMIFAPCGVQFQIDNYDPVNPQEKGFDFQLSQFESLDQIRYEYGEFGTLLAVTTGEWTGALQAKGANAWTQPPQSNVFGVVLESRVATYPNILAHEVGHYLNLPHIEDSNNVLNPIVYRKSTRLSASQCNTVINAIQEFWPEVIRSNIN